VAFEIVLSPRALDDLKSNFDFVADSAGIDTATAYDGAIRAACFALADFPRRGRPRDEIGPGLRSVPAARSVTIYYSVGATEVQIVRVIHARRDTAAAFADE
jgi:toxin ParE1/3/4